MPLDLGKMLFLYCYYIGKVYINSAIFIGKV